jgi:hypothetical protein
MSSDYNLDGTETVREYGTGNDQALIAVLRDGRELIGASLCRHRAEAHLLRTAARHGGERNGRGPHTSHTPQCPSFPDLHAGRMLSRRAPNSQDQSPCTRTVEL